MKALLSGISLTFLATFLLTGCTDGGIFDRSSYDHIDREYELSRDDYLQMARPTPKQEEKLAQQKSRRKPPPVPEIAQILAAPKRPKVGKNKLVTVSVTDDVPLKDVLIELARLADVDIELGSGIEGGISFRAKDKPFSDVIERIANLAGLRYKMHNGTLRIERDLPYVKNYSIDFLNMIRNSTSQVSIATDVLTAGSDSGSGGGGGGGGSGGGGSGGGSQEGLSTGTTSSITSNSESDFWASLQAGLTEILGYVPGTGLPDMRSENERQSTGSGDTNKGANGAFYVVNRQAGILSVSGSERQHLMVNEYLKMLERNASAQVLIEAKIIEVELDRQYQSGVNWTAVLGNSDFALNLPQTSITNGLSWSMLGPGFDDDGVGALNPTGDNNLGVDLDSVVQLTERFGTSRTLSSPRLHAINNQQSVLTFAENKIFFEVDVEREDDQIVDGTVIPGTTTVESTRRSVPIGIILSILPSINLDRSEVTLSVRPTLSRQVSTVTDPGSAVANSILTATDPNAEGFTNEVPVVEVRELDSVMKVRSGGVMIIGGLMEDVNTNVDEGVPWVSEVPFIGNAFKRTNKVTQKRELIILIKASIVGPDGHYAPADRTIYDKFSDDPRPLMF
ncbi:MAG: secretin N-terminal domain-containing protein [Rickettsiales bacterium]|nr:secretin N-terminal domain-containing protein [Rickettsiales bacterium]